MQNLVVGVVTLGGGGGEHLAMLHRVGALGRAVEEPGALVGLDALIVPGGKSTLIGEALGAAGLVQPLRQAAASGLPVWGTCAGLVLMARESGRRQLLLGLLDVTVRRNAFGHENEDFDVAVPMAAVGWPPYPAAFRAAPVVESVGPGVRVLVTLEEGTIVAVRQGHLLGTAFHPEQTNDPRWHAYFLRLAERGLGRRRGARHLTPSGVPDRADGRRPGSPPA